MTTQPTDLSIINRCIAGALEKLANDAQREATDEMVIDPAERKHFRAWAAAYRKALYYHLQGVQPLSTPAGGWLIPSATRGGMIHEVNKQGACTCEGGAKGGACWHAAYALGLDIGWDAVRDEGHEPELTKTPYEEALADLMDCF